MPAWGCLRSVGGWLGLGPKERIQVEVDAGSTPAAGQLRAGEGGVPASCSEASERGGNCSSTDRCLSTVPVVADEVCAGPPLPGLLGLASAPADALAAIISSSGWLSERETCRLSCTLPTRLLPRVEREPRSPWSAELMRKPLPLPPTAAPPGLIPRGCMRVPAVPLRGAGWCRGADCAPVSSTASSSTTVLMAENGKRAASTAANSANWRSTSSSSSVAFMKASEWLSVRVGAWGILGWLPRETYKGNGWTGIKPGWA